MDTDVLLSRRAASRAVDMQAAQQAVTALLTALGVDLQQSHTRDTPRRVAEWYAELLGPVTFHPTTFPNEESYDEMVVIRSIPFHSLCSHHLLPFIGHASVAYIPDKHIVGLSKLARVVLSVARGLQVQERLTMQIAQWISDELAPKGVGVVVSAEHMCMTMRGVQAIGSVTTTSCLRGLIREDEKTRAEFLALIPRPPA